MSGISFDFTMATPNLLLAPTTAIAENETFLFDPNSHVTDPDMFPRIPMLLPAVRGQT